MHRPDATTPARPAVPDPDVRASLGNIRRMLQMLGIKEDEVVLGGGTDLAVHWNHRISKDIDLVCPGHVYRERCRALMAPDGKKMSPDAKKGIMNTTGVSVKKQNEHRISWVDNVPGTQRTRKGGYRQVPVYGTLFARDDWNETERPGGDLDRELPFERHHRFRLAPIAFVLHGKIAGRTLNNGHIIPRDMHDVLVATRRAPQALEEALRDIEDDALRRIGEKITELSADPTWNGTKPSPRQQAITEPAYAQWTGNALWTESRRFWTIGYKKYLEEVDAARMPNTATRPRGKAGDQGREHEA